MATTGEAAAAWWMDLITVHPAVAHGQACIRGTRVPASIVLDCLAGGLTYDEILAEYPTLTVESIRAAVGYGAVLAREEVLPIPPEAG